MKYFFIIIILQFNLHAFSQKVEFEYSFTSDILSNVKNVKLSRDLKFIAEQLLFIGEYKKALQIKDLSEYLLSGELLNERTSNIKKNKAYTLIPAKKYIVEKSKTEKIIIINEDHHQPLHRVFTTSLLKELYQNGYKYLAIETLAEDSALNINKYPVTSSGYYSSEPQYGNLIREALSLGYKLVSYEHNGQGGWNKREFAQASNIKKKTFDIDPNAKVLIHCGYAHGMEMTDGNDTLMGGWIKVLTGINPLTINQTTLTEHSSEEFENIFYGQLKNDCTSIFVHKGALYDSYIKTIDLQEYDIDIYHPRTTYIYGRPNWLNISGEKKYYFPSDDKRIILKYPIIVSAFHPSENFNNVVPIDCIELLSDNDMKSLVLKPGKYVLQIKSKEKKEQQIEIEIK